MQKVNIHEAKTRLSYLIDNAVKGKISVPADFDSMGKKN